ncbi:hypothetical protein CCS77_1872 [Campylobacter concisus]|uniref:Uncharacterized protein n=1 Tax=Campylobacter concisus TaxID=199 RepID=A0A2R4P2L8_9BACT|nr:hypothetical protein CCS77_1872 [Campylobacter concisus]
MGANLSLVFLPLNLIYFAKRLQNEENNIVSIYTLDGYVCG